MTDKTLHLSATHLQALAAVTPHPNVVPNAIAPGPGLWAAAIAVVGTLLGAMVGGFVQNRNARLAELRKEKRSAELARRRIRVLLRAEMANFGPFGGYMNHGHFDLLETAHDRLRERWDDDELLSAFADDEYELIDGLINQAERTIAKIRTAVHASTDAMKDLSKITPGDWLGITQHLILSYSKDVEKVFGMLQRAFATLDDSNLAAQSAHALERTKSRCVELSKNLGMSDDDDTAIGGLEMPR